MNEKKLYFLKNDFIPSLQKISIDTKPAWGKMNLIQMIEHMSDSVRMANGKVVHSEIISPLENIPKMQAFIMGDIPFKENTKNRMLSEEPARARNQNLNDAIKELQGEMDDFFALFEANSAIKLINPIFGELDYSGWVSLLYKHAIHHLTQFNSFK